MYTSSKHVANIVVNKERPVMKNSRRVNNVFFDERDNALDMETALQAAFHNTLPFVRWSLSLMDHDASKSKVI